MLGVGDLTLSCASGYIKSIDHFGIVPSDGKVKDTCVENDETNGCEKFFD